MPDNNTESITKAEPENQTIEFPKKHLHRQRAHCNPLSDSFIPYPENPRHVNWFKRYPSVCEKEHYMQFNSYSWYVNLEDENYPKVDFLDVGCGYGGLLIYLSKLYPNKLSLGMEIRDKVTNYVGKRIISLREQNPGEYLNISVVRTNSMKFLPNYLGKNQLEKIFFCFPDPHFKRSNWRRRIVNYPLLSLYAYFLKPGGRIYIGIVNLTALIHYIILISSVIVTDVLVTDVYELYVWMENALEDHPLFEPLKDSDKEKDECFLNFDKETEEGKKNEKMQSTTYKNVYRRK
ncbi:trna (guanine-n-(7))-methyltransferase, putative [Theileria annulata]|uniref:tRNA (guanine-N(7)-)-methyltransferase n=1 Tax=Theileria annulata TaxID=5874 RepID=Q4UGV7_THEAN|nr:trna (guanine-n-(7))-methyltransferase, putative [Theileria annulata]CAI73682.1 trna (guanine-n-(7))-methyltransferase, putative [Theileria annulata]|eukprot:XP_954359.1 trna (guanine-n-(7))-methyltransferase, putative [Theileria annulata]